MDQLRNQHEPCPKRQAGAGDARMVVSATFASRILGYGRDMLIAWSFGAGMVADAFIVAFRLPNLFRRLVGEGALGMAFIPVFQEHARRRGKKSAIDLAVVASRRLAAFLGIFVLLALAFAPMIVGLLAPGFASSGAKLALTVHLTRIMMPCLLLMGLTALSMSILNALGHFTAPALAPIALNVAMIAAVLAGIWLTPSTALRAGILAAGVVVGGLLQLVLQVPVLARYGVRFWRPARLEADLLGRFGRMAVPVMLGGAAYQVNVLLGTFLASYLAAGSVSSLFYADRLVQFPLGLFAVSAVTVMMPDLSRQAAAQHLEAMKQTLRESLKMVWFVTVPAMAGLIVLREPIVSLLFERGAFGSDSARLTAEALLWYGTGLWAYAALRILLAMFYAMQDARRPLQAAAASVMVNLGAGILLMPLMGHGGIALAASMAAAVNMGILAIMLRRQIGPLGTGQMIPAAARILGCSFLMGAVVHGLKVRMAPIAARGTVFEIGSLAACIAAGTCVYAAAAFVCRSRELRTCCHMVYRRKKLP